MYLVGFDISHLTLQDPLIRGLHINGSVITVGNKYFNMAEISGIGWSGTITNPSTSHDILYFGQPYEAYIFNLFIPIKTLVVKRKSVIFAADIFCTPMSIADIFEYNGAKRRNINYILTEGATLWINNENA